MYRNSEGYKDPTAGKAVGNAVRDSRRMERKEKSRSQIGGRKMTKLTAKEYLMQAHNLNARIDAHLREKEELQEMAYSINSIQSGERVQTSPSGEAPYARIIEKISDLEDLITTEIDRLVDLKTEIYKSVSAMPDPDEQTVLLYRYCAGYSWDEIGMALHVSRSTAQRIHDSALYHFVVPD